MNNPSQLPLTKTIWIYFIPNVSVHTYSIPRPKAYHKCGLLLKK